MIRLPCVWWENCRAGVLLCGAGAYRNALHYIPTAIRDTGFLCSLTRWWNNCLWLPLPAWYGCTHAHAWGTGQDVGWCMCASCSLRSCTQRSCPGSKGSLRHKFSPFIDLTIIPWCWAPVRAKQLSMAATHWVIWLYACMRYWPGGGLVFVYLLLWLFSC